MASYSYGEWQYWVYQNSETPEPIVTEFGIGDYVGDITPHDKIQSSGGVLANGWNIILAWFLWFLDFPFLRPQILLASRENRFLVSCLIHRMSIPDYCTHTRGMQVKTTKSFQFPHFTPKKAWIGIFKPNAYYRNYCTDSNQILNGDKDHQIRFVGGQNRSNTRWRTVAILKNQKTAGLTDRHKIWQGDAYLPSKV